MTLSQKQLSTCILEIPQLLQDWERSYVTPSSDKRVKTGTTASRDVVVAFRTRPVLPTELPTVSSHFGNDKIDNGGGADDLVQSSPCLGISVKQVEPGITVVHLPSMKWNGLALTHKFFESDLAFGPESSNETIYGLTVDAQNMIPLVLAGGVAAILAYGQTGTGKTYSMTFLELSIARDLFQKAAEVGSKMKREISGASEGALNRDGSEVFEITITCLEIIGKVGYDLAAEDTENETRQPVSITEDKLGIVRPELTILKVVNTSELEAAIVKCLSYRRTASTARNASSSRSHAILTIRVKNILIPQLADGEFILVDLAGTERYEDRKAHSKQLMEESKENNKSLLALKECVRARAKAGSEDGFVHIPYRSSRLTWVLKPLFDMEETRPTKTLIIAHISPLICDSSHSANTLSYAAPFRIIPARRQPAPFDAKDPRTWDNASTIKWLTVSFTKQQEVRRQAAWDCQQAEALKNGKRLRPLLALPHERRNLVSFEKLCPAPYGGAYLARLYGANWVQECLQNRSFTSLSKADEESLVAAIQDDSLNVYLEFSQMLLYARTQTRNAVMHSRKVQDKDNGFSGELGKMSEEERLDYFSVFSPMALDDMATEWLKNGSSPHTVRQGVHKHTITLYRAQRAREKAERERIEEADRERLEGIHELIDFVDSGF